MYFKAVSERNVASYFPSISAVLDNVRLNGSPEECALADYHGGRLFLACGDYIKAKALLQSALRFFPNLLSARIQYTNAFLLSGDIKHGLELLVNLQKEYPNQKEIQELMCVYASENGVYDVALQCSRRLSASVEQGDINSSMISLWCSRFSSAEHSRLLAQVIKLLKTMQQEVPLELYCNYATATEDADALQALIDNELGGNVLEKDSLSAQHIPLLYNLALLLEKNGKDEPRAKKIHMHIIKHHGCFVPSYIRLHELARRRGSMKESVSWLTLLSQVMSDEPIARSYLGNLLLEEQEVLLSTKLLRGCSENSALTAILSCASAYFELSQIPSQNGESYLKKSKQMFQYALRRDSSNILAAHGLACCLGVEQNFEVCQLLLKHINEVIPNADFVRQSHSAHMANIKTISETFKGAVDYAEKEEKQTPELECMLAFCLSVENQYDKAIEICERVAKENPNEPMFSYNLVLLLLAAFNHGLCGHSPLSMADGEKV
ncbi:RNA polymerase-associated protein CTR9 [Angomonas deanei]|uniref:Tetratricopeptide repeat n=1 Tax=Angomonas deanei TaxID=59799 RepID=A0A7G2CH25_9TRYP|nr:RNA polymerase-associated protein CTR9 [Angomonas deanei]CAD2218645.1 hypothetical protein, conserved [Angomonas deanei]|eukprot:EPY22799.1 RNA polymerase-associated protein CTR9 [Angomonas deanei]